jgi:hypothetical protein
MNIQDTRIARLRQWFSDKSVPADEKSFISQLLSKKAPFGERAARRLERTYGMGEFYLDDSSQTTEAAATTEGDPLGEAVRLLSLFQRGDARARQSMLRHAEELIRTSAKSSAVGNDS